jgi:hypothetical protein
MIFESQLVSMDWLTSMKEGSTEGIVIGIVMTGTVAGIVMTGTETGIAITVVMTETAGSNYNEQLAISKGLFIWRGSFQHS